MPRILATAVLLAAAFTATPASVHPASAGQGPWCAEMNMGFGNISRECSFRTFEECLPYVVAGNRGFCTANPNWAGPVDRHQPRHYRRAPRY